MNEKEFDIFFREKCFENNINILPKDIKKFTINASKNTCPMVYA